MGRRYYNRGLVSLDGTNRKEVDMPFRRLVFIDGALRLVDVPDEVLAADSGLLITRRSGQMNLTNYTAVPVTIRHWVGDRFITHRLPISVTRAPDVHDTVVLGDEEYEYRRRGVRT